MVEPCGIQNYQELGFFNLIRKPFFFNHLVRATSNRYLNFFLDRINGDEAVILDVGCGPHTVVPDGYRVIRCDYSMDNTPQIVASADSLPFADQSVDHLVLSWVFEHLEEPGIVLQECYRVIKEGGTLYLTTNFVWHMHEEPRDFFRFTEYGLRYLFKKYGAWEIYFLEPTLGYWGTITQILNYRIVRLFAKLRVSRLHFFMTLPLQLIGLFFERLDPNFSVCAGYCVMARKK